MKIELTETWLLALVSLIIGFIIQFCRTAEQSRCKNIVLCWGLIDCKREPLPAETILEMRSEDEEKKAEP